MQGLLAFLTFLVAMGASAANHEYEIAMQIYVDGKLISSPTITTSKGEDTELTQVNPAINYKFRVKLSASDKDHPNIGKGILVKLNLDYETGKKEDTKTYKHYESQPEILVQAGREGSITTKTKAGQEILTVKVIAKRI